MADWRTVQVFLSPRQPTVYEVELNLDNADARCSCPTYRARTACRHTKAVKTRMRDAGGHYPIMLHENAETSDLSDSLDDPKTFREFVVRFGKVEVL
jgi:hypothetical protein